MPDVVALHKQVFPAVSRFMGEIRQLLPREQNKYVDSGGIENLTDLTGEAIMVSGTLQDHIAGDVLEWTLMEAIAQEAGHQQTFDELQRLCEGLDLLFSSTLGNALLDLPATHYNLSGIVPRVDRLVSAVRAKLSMGPVQIHAVRRLKTYFEHFARDHVRELCQKEKDQAALRAQVSGGTARVNYERVLQHEMDNFLFHEGLFPVTHAEASAGIIDTFAIPTIKLDEARETHQPAVLIELKQALDDPSDTDLVSAVQQALHQVERYSSHVRANPEWGNHKVFAVVVYDGPEYFRIDDEQVVLVYIGTATPSKKARVLSVS